MVEDFGREERRQSLQRQYGELVKQLRAAPKGRERAEIAIQLQAKIQGIRQMISEERRSPCSDLYCVKYGTETDDKGLRCCGWHKSGKEPPGYCNPFK